MIITWGVDEVALGFVLLDKIVKSKRSERGSEREGGGECYGDYSHLSEQVSLFCTCGSAAPLVLLTLILCMQPALRNMMLFIDYLCY